MAVVAITQPRQPPGLLFAPWQRMTVRIVSLVLATLMGVAMPGASVFAQTCLRPQWTECVLFPNGGRHTGVNSDDKPVEAQVPPASDICVVNEWEIRAETYAQFHRNGVPWPNRDWEVRVETFCFYKND